MKRGLLLLTVIAAAACYGHAEDILQILPQEIVKGSTSDDARTFEIELVNESEFVALQFDLYLPEGMEFDDIDPIEMNKDRFPHTTGRGGVVKFDHTVSYSKRPDGFYRVLIGFSDAEKVNSKISGHSGTLFTIYYVTSNDLAEGVLPVKIDNVTFAISGTQGIYPEASSSFFYSGDFDPETTPTLDLSGLTGYMAAGVVDATNQLISTNAELTEIRADNLSDTGAQFAPFDPNCLVYLQQGSNAFDKGVASGNAVGVDAGVATATTMALTDGNNFGCTSPVECSNINYSRDFTIGSWQALYLPYDISYNDWAPYGTVARLKGVRTDAGTDLLVWEIVDNGDIAANTPCIFKPANVGQMQIDVNNRELTPDTQANRVQYTSDSGVTYSLSGSYTFKGDMASTSAYGLADGNFHPASSDAVKLPPFRIYLNIEGAIARIPRVCCIFEDGTTLIESLDNDQPSDTIYYDLNGREASTSIPGLYITRNNKILIK